MRLCWFAFYADIHYTSPGMGTHTPSRPAAWHLLVLLLVLAALLAEFVFMSQAPLLSDESFNFRQIFRFVSRDFTMEPLMNVIPGYHALVASALAVFGKAGKFSARLVSVMISAAAVAMFYLLTWKIHARPSITRTLQFAFLPLLFPFFALIYTDVLALLLVLAAFYLTLCKRYNLAGLVGILSILVRTNNITWFVFLYVFIYYNTYGMDMRQFIPSLRQTWVFWLGFGLFLAFLIWNGGIAIGDRLAQPMNRLEIGNISFLLFAFALLLLPLNLANLPGIGRLEVTRRWVLPVILVICLVLFLAYHNTHPFNNVYPDYYLRNGFLMRLVTDLPLRAAFFGLAAFSLLSLGATSLVEKRFYWLYPFTLLSLLPIWLIEPRYYFVPLSLFLLFRVERRGWVEWLQVAYGAALSLVLLYYIRSSTIFI
jgi:alpha-1,2-glucosyltransferase